MIWRGIQRGPAIEDLDRGVSKEGEYLVENPDFVTITCGQCDEKILVEKGKGIIKIKCPNCSGEYRVKT